MLTANSRSSNNNKNDNSNPYSIYRCGVLCARRKKRRNQPDAAQAFVVDVDVAIVAISGRARSAPARDNKLQKRAASYAVRFNHPATYCGHYLWPQRWVNQILNSTHTHTQHSLLFTPLHHTPPVSSARVVAAENNRAERTKLSFHSHSHSYMCSLRSSGRQLSVVVSRQLLALTAATTDNC